MIAELLSILCPVIPVVNLFDALYRFSFHSVFCVSYAHRHGFGRFTLIAQPPPHLPALVFANPDQRDFYLAAPAAESSPARGELKLCLTLRHEEVLSPES